MKHLVISFIKWVYVNIGTIYVCKYVLVRIGMLKLPNRQDRNVEGSSENIDLATHASKIHDVIDDDQLGNLTLIRGRTS